MEFIWYLSGPLMVFLGVVLPLWLIFHYVTKWKRMKSANVGPNRVVVERSELQQLRETAERLEGRIESLEKILDEEKSSWRVK